MEKIKLVLPSYEYEMQVMEYKMEFLENGDSLDGTAGLRNYNLFKDWYEDLIDNSKEETVREDLVPSTTYLAISLVDNRVIGMIDIRHRLNDYLLNFGGHIGYSVRKSDRKKGYATEMLRLALIECDKMDIKEILVTCDKDNIASAKTILNNGGVLENEILEEEGVIQRYWIRL